MRTRADVIAIVMIVGFIAGCGYSLPAPLKIRVAALSRQSDNVVGVVQTIKRQAKAGKVEAAALRNAETKYGELIAAHDAWLGHVKRVISKEIDHFENDEKYQNSVTKLVTAGAEFEKAADAALGSPSSPTDVPDWADEAREIVTLAYNERHMKDAASAIHTQLRMKRWKEIEL